MKERAIQVRQLKYESNFPSKMKKEYMTLSDIKRKLKAKLTQEEKEVEKELGTKDFQIKYLEKIRRKKGLLQPETRYNVNKALDDLYAHESRTLMVRGYKARFSGQDPYQLDHASDILDKRGMLAEERGQVKSAIKFYEKARKLNDYATKSGSTCWTPICNDTHLADLYERAEMFSKARALRRKAAA